MAMDGSRSFNSKMVANLLHYILYHRDLSRREPHIQTPKFLPRSFWFTLKYCIEKNYFPTHFLGPIQFV